MDRLKTAAELAIVGGALVATAYYAHERGKEKAETIIVEAPITKTRTVFVDPSIPYYLEPNGQEMKFEFNEDFLLNLTRGDLENHEWVKYISQFGDGIDYANIRVRGIQCCSNPVCVDSCISQCNEEINCFARIEYVVTISRGIIGLNADWTHIGLFIVVKGLVCVDSPCPQQAAEFRVQ